MIEILSWVVAFVLVFGVAAMLDRLGRRLTAIEELIDKLHPEAGWIEAGGDWPIRYPEPRDPGTEIHAKMDALGREIVARCREEL